jgi:hypothetical protein
VKRRILILIERFCLSTKLVLTCLGSGFPLTTFISQPMHFAGLYLEAVENAFGADIDYQLNYRPKTSGSL